MSRTKEIGHDAGLLLGKSLANGLHDVDPVVRKQAEGTRDLIEARLLELGVHEETSARRASRSFRTRSTRRTPTSRPRPSARRA
jgi:hypothetical protein